MPNDHPSIGGEIPADGLERMTAVVVSTAHVSRATADALSALPPEAWPFSGFTGPYGWIVYTAHPESSYAQYPELAAVLAWARAKGFAWVRFDADGDRVPELATFEW